MASVATNGYRRLLKAAGVAFRKDAFALVKARMELRQEFLRNKNVVDTNHLAVILLG